MNDKIYGSKTIANKIVDQRALKYDLETYGYDKSVDNGASFYGVSSDSKAYFDWKREVMKTEEHLPLAKLAWDAALKYERKEPA